MRKVSTVTGIAEGRVAILVTVDVFRLSDGVRNSKMLTVTGIAEGRLAIRVTVDVFRLSDDVLKSKMSTVTGIAEGRVAILVTVDVFRLSDNVPKSKMSTVTGIAEGRVAILVTVDAFRLSDAVLNSKNVDSYRDRGRQGRHPRNYSRFWTLTPAWKFKSVDSPFAKQNKMMRTCRLALLGFARTYRFLLSPARSCLRMPCYKYERGGWGGRSHPHLQNIEWDGKALLAKRYFLLSLAKICLLRSCPKKMSGGVWGGRSPPHLQNI